MAAFPDRGDVWLVDLGTVAKVRPCMILSIPPDQDTDRVLVTVVPHTTSTRNSRFEIIASVRFLEDGAFDTQNLITIPVVKLIRRLGRLSADQLIQVDTGVKHWLGFEPI